MCSGVMQGGAGSPETSGSSPFSFFFHLLYVPCLLPFLLDNFDFWYSRIISYFYSFVGLHVGSGCSGRVRPKSNTQECGHEGQDATRSLRYCTHFWTNCCYLYAVIAATTVVVAADSGNDAPTAVPGRNKRKRN